MRISKLIWFVFVAILILNSCQSKVLPVLKQIDEDYSFINQDSTEVTPEMFDGKIYVTDFFFTTCPTICPKMTQQMARIYERFEDEPDVLLLSHSIDTRNDDVPTLNAYSKKLGVSSEKWHFVTGKKEDIYSMAKIYMITALEDEEAEGGYIHSGKFVLIDRQGRVRGYYDGTEAEQVDILMGDLERLLKSEDLIDG